MDDGQKRRGEYKSKVNTMTFNADISSHRNLVNNGQNQPELKVDETEWTGAFSPESLSISITRAYIPKWTEIIERTSFVLIRHFSPDASAQDIQSFATKLSSLADRCGFGLRRLLLQTNATQLAGNECARNQPGIYGPGGAHRRWRHDYGSRWS